MTANCCLASLDIGRVAVVEDGFPLVFPINYKLATFGGKLVIAIRTRPGNVIDHPGGRCASRSTASTRLETVGGACWYAECSSNHHPTLTTTATRSTRRIAMRGE